MLQICNFYSWFSNPICGFECSEDEAGIYLTWSDQFLWQMLILFQWWVVHFCPPIFDPITPILIATVEINWMSSFTFLSLAFDLSHANCTFKNVNLNLHFHGSNQRTRTKMLQKCSKIEYLNFQKRIYHLNFQFDICINSFS